MSRRAIALVVLLAAILAAGLSFALVRTNQPAPAAEVLPQAATGLESEEPVPAKPLRRAEAHPAVNISVVPGLQKTRDRLVKIEEAREDIKESAGEDAPERY